MVNRIAKGVSNHGLGLENPNWSFFQWIRNKEKYQVYLLWPLAITFAVSKESVLDIL